MKPSRKLYKVKIGIVEDREYTHFDSKNVVAGDVEEAIRKGKSRKKGTYISSVEMLYEINKL